MVKGAITTRHILIHPILITHLFGFKKYLRLIVKCLSHNDHCFIEILYK